MFRRVQHILVHDLLSIGFITKCQLYLRAEFGCQSPSLFCIARYKTELNEGERSWWLVIQPPNSGPFM